MYSIFRSTKPFFCQHMCNYSNSTGKEVIALVSSCPMYFYLVNNLSFVYSFFSPKLLFTASKHNSISSILKAAVEQDICHSFFKSDYFFNLTGEKFKDSFYKV